MIVWDKHNPSAVQLHSELLTLLPSDRTLDDSVIVVIGGDGFLLRTADEYGIDCAYLGLNAGHVGFLLNNVGSLQETARDISEKRWKEYAFPLIEAEIEHDDGQRSVHRAINDIYLERMTGQTARVSLTIDGHHVVRELVADGLVFATALGSTAYAFSAGSIPVHPELSVLQVTPICPHVPRLTPFTLPANATAHVEVHDRRWRPVRAVTDGRGHDNVCTVGVRQSEHKVRLCYLTPHDFTQQLLTKIVQPHTAGS